MATGAQAGRLGSLLFGASTSALGEIGEVRNWRVGMTHRPIDATSNDSSGWDEAIRGQTGWTMTAEAMYLRTDADQVALRKMMSTSGSKLFRLFPSTAQTARWHGTGWLTNYTVGGTHDAPVLFNVEIQGTGALTYTT